MLNNKKRKEYFFIKYDGNYLDMSSLPSYQEVFKSDVTGRPYNLILDNNVCIHISDSDNSKQCQKKKAKAKNLLEYVRSFKITVNPTWGLLERASKPGTLNLDLNKLKDFENVFWAKLSRYSNNDLLSSSVDSINSDKAILYPFYMYLLKIKLIVSKNDCDISNAKANLIELYDFMNDIQMFSAIIWQIAMGIIGGDVSANKFIKHGRKGKRDIFKDLWGAAWDVYYLQLSQWFHGLRQINNSYPQTILVTDDYDCAMVGSLTKVIGNIEYGNVALDPTLTSFNFPYWKQRDIFLHKLSWEINNEITKRAIKRNSLSEVERQNELDLIIYNSSYQISQLTQKLKAFSNKGFST